MVSICKSSRAVNCHNRSNVLVGVGQVIQFVSLTIFESVSNKKVNLVDSHRCQIRVVKMYFCDMDMFEMLTLWQHYHKILLKIIKF
jgi:hypothetical protein